MIENAKEFEKQRENGKITINDIGANEEYQGRYTRDSGTIWTWGKLHFGKKIARDRANFKHGFCI